MWRLKLGVNRIEKIRNAEVRARTGVANIREEMRSETDMVNTCREKDRGRCRNEKMVEIEC